MLQDPSIIKIIPKPKVETPFKVNLWVVLSAGLFLVSLGTFVFLNSYLNPSWDQKRISAEQELMTLDTGDNFDLKNDLVQTASKIGDFSSLWSKHYFASRVFDFLKSICLKKVRLKSVNLGFEAGRVTLSLDAQTDHFKTLGEQLLSLRENPAVRQLSASGVSLSDSGVSFNLSIELADNVFTSANQ
ncbi:MAG: hypothetical protein PHN39_00695 [Candidatus Pacebacteria bacterium]|nr:hypothetical protein [Candidatus Paceibacterota bacterium]